MKTQVAVVFPVILVLSCPGAVAQQNPVLRITSPASGVVVHPGTTVTVTVQCADTSAVTQVSLLGDAGLGTVLQNVAASMTFKVNLPAALKPGRYRIRAFGGKVSGQGVTEISDEVALQVPIEEAIYSFVTPVPAEVNLLHPGLSQQILVYANTSFGETTLNDLSQLSATTMDSSIASVNSELMVTGRHAGQTTIKLKFTDGAGSVQNVDVPVKVGTLVKPGDFNGDGNVDMDDVDELKADILGGVIPIAGDPRDLNNDGKIDAVDVQILTSLAAHPHPRFNDFAGNGRSGALLYDPSTGQSYTAVSNGTGSFYYSPKLLTAGFDILRTGDFNGDGKTDLVLYNSHTALAYIGTSDGTGAFAFQSLFWSPGYDFVESGDLNGDSKTDFVLYNSATGTLYTAISNGSAAFSYKYSLVSKGFTFLRVADLTGDGKSDVFAYSAATGQVIAGVADGSGGFAFHSLSISPNFNLIDIGDLNSDGRMDAILYNSTSGFTATAISDGAGGFAFTPTSFSPGFTSVRLADYSGDGKADVSVYNKNTAAAYFGTGTGTGSFNFQSLFWSPGYNYVEPQDVDGDGKLDVVLYNSATGTEYTGISNGNGTFNYTYQYWGIGRVLARP